MPTSSDDRPGGPAAAIMPWLSVTDAAKAVSFYRAALGAEVGEVAEFDGVIEVAELVIRQVSFWVQRDPELPKAVSPSETAREVLVVPDPALSFDVAVTAGATVIEEIHDQGGWQTCRVADPFGNHWEFARRLS